MKSISARLALWYAGVSTATLVCLTVAGYFLLHEHLVHGLVLLNAAEFEQIRSSLGPDHASLTPEQIQQRIKRPTEAAAVFFYVEVHRRRSGVVFTSGNLREWRLPERADRKTFGATVGDLGELQISIFDLGDLEVIIGTPLGQVQKVMEGYTETSLILVCLMLVLSVLTGLALSRVAMRPVRLIQETANQIRSDNLGKRIPVGEVRDEISNLARLLNSMFDRLEASFNQIRKFTSEASHELKTPLSLVRLQAEKLVMEGGLTPTQEEAVQMQLEEIARLNKIIDELLFLSRAEVHAVKLDFRREDPRAFLQSFVQDARALAEHRGMSFAATIEGVGEVEHDPKWLRQVLLNLLQNTLNVSPPGGRVTLRSEFTVDAWRVALEDQGPGVPPEQRERIFQRFVRLGGEERGYERGSGLGLTICRSIIGLHHGTIRAEAAPAGTGLRVVFELPLGPAPAGPASELADRISAVTD
jgi:two-component system heavy metal sensor histidine kinase CusS